MRLSRLLLLLLPATVLAADALQDRIRLRIGDFSGTVSLYARNLDTGAAVGLREAEPVRTASTIKLPILLAVFDAVARGEGKWTDPLTVTAAEKVAGSGVIASELSDGVVLPLRDAANLMIVLSDNTATNLILDRFGTDAVNAYLEKLGLKATRSMRKILGNNAERRGVSAAGKLPENQKYGIGVSTPREMVAILEKLERGEAVSPEASKQMLEILRRCQDDSGIRRRFSGVRIVNKTGALDALRSDVGIVYSNGGRIAMAITVDGMPKADWSPDNPGEILIADLAKLLVDGLAKPER
jgi:beta-lactamase class A